MVNIFHQPGQRRHQTPAQKNARNPDARPNLVQHQIAGHFKQEVSDEENTGGQSILLAGEAQIFVHGQSGKANVDAVHERDDVKQEEKRNQPDLQFMNGLGFVGQNSRVWFAGHYHLSVRLPRSKGLFSAAWLADAAQGLPRLYGGAIFPPIPHLRFLLKPVLPPETQMAFHFNKQKRIFYLLSLPPPPSIESVVG